MKTNQIVSEYEALRALDLVEEFDTETGELIDNSKEMKELLDGIATERDTKLKGIEYIKRVYFY